MTSTTLEFEYFPKIPRLKNSLMRITEKIDGTNAQIVIPEDPNQPIQAGSRNRWIWPNTAENKQLDNYGFAAWVRDNEAMLRRLGPGRHYGEWWGQGIGRKYDMETKVFSLFNVARYKDGLPEGVPCRLVPVLYEGPVMVEMPEYCRNSLIKDGSAAKSGFMSPEGTVVQIGNFTYKDIIEKTGPSPEQLPSTDMLHHGGGM